MSVWILVIYSSIDIDYNVVKKLLLINKISSDMYFVNSNKYEIHAYVFKNNEFKVDSFTSTSATVRIRLTFDKDWGQFELSRTNSIDDIHTTLDIMNDWENRFMWTYEDFTLTMLPYCDYIRINNVYGVVDNPCELVKKLAKGESVFTISRHMVLSPFRLNLNSFTENLFDIVNGNKYVGFLESLLEKIYACSDEFCILK